MIIPYTIKVAGKRNNLSGRKHSHMHSTEMSWERGKEKTKEIRKREMEVSACDGCLWWIFSLGRWCQ